MTNSPRRPKKKPNRPNKPKENEPKGPREPREPRDSKGPVVGGGGPSDPSDPIDPTGPGGPIDGVDLSILTYRQKFAELDPGLPLALLPVRIETKYVGRPNPTELLVRVYPDLIHADAHESGLTELEVDLGKAFWDRTWRSGSEPEALDAAFAWLADHVGPWRAAWIASQLTPLNLQLAPDVATPDDVALKPPPKFPEVDSAGGAPATYARLLPERWVVVGYGDTDQAVGNWYGKVIDTTIAMAPGLAEAGGDGSTELDGQGLLDAQGMAWTHNPDAAEEAGMLIRVDLAELGSTRFKELFVFGINTDLGSDDLEALVTSHRYTHGLDLIPQGTPTNSTETAQASWHPSRPTAGAVRESELERAPVLTRPEVDLDGDLFRMTGANALSVAFGLGRNNAIDRSIHADIAELSHAEAMNKSLWSATMGHYLRLVLGNVVDTEGRAWLRDWATTFVRGAGVMPTLLVGSQPYGVVPVSYIDKNFLESNNIGLVEDVVSAATSHWRDALPLVPHLDHNLTDADPTFDTDGTLAASVSQVFGAVPHPTLLRLRNVDQMRDEYNEQYGGNLFALGFESLGFPRPDPADGSFGPDPDNVAFQFYETLVDDLALDATPEGQRNSWEDASTSYRLTTGTSSQGDFTQAQLDYLHMLADRIDDNVVPMLTAHIERVKPIRNLLTADVEATGMLSENDDPHAYFTLHDDLGTEKAWVAPLVAVDDSAEALEALGDFIGDLRSRVAGGLGSLGGFDQERPLLEHMLNRSADQATTEADKDTLLAGLDGLLECLVDESTSVHSIERLLREALGVVSYRLDAWYTGTAAWRLDNKRAKAARGLHIGAYGVVVDLRPRSGRASEGYVLAPSLSHATTAAVLRSGWAAFGGSSTTSGLAVDLSSDRIRRAKWIIDGVRRGQDVAELLGSRFERRLHDAGLDRWVRPFREFVLEASGSPAAPNAIVDGLLLARGSGGGPDLTAAEQFIADELKGWLAGSERPPGNPDRVVDQLVVDLDAAADAAAAQSVFSLVEGNVPEATATLTAAGSGETNFPHLRFADSQRPATTITHRLLSFLDPTGTSQWPGASTSGRSIAAPAVDAWVGALLGNPAAVEFDVSFVDEHGIRLSGGTISLAGLGLSALDTIYLAPVGEDPGLGRLGTLIEASAEHLRPSDAENADVVIDSDSGNPSLGDFVIVARALRTLVAGASDLDGRGMAEAGAVDVASGIDFGEYETRVTTVAAALDARISALTDAIAAADTDGIRAAMIDFAGYEFASFVPRADGTDELAAQAQRLVDVGLKRLERYAALVADGPDDLSTQGDDARLRVSRSRLDLLLGLRMPHAPTFVASNGSELAVSFGRPRLTSSAEAAGWLAAAGRVEGGAENLRLAVDLVEALHDSMVDHRLAFSLAQLPDHETEGWAAIERPRVDSRGRVCLLGIGGVPDPLAPMAGLQFASWTEPIPAVRQTPGLSFHFDAPSSRPPQAILLCVARPDLGFSIDFVTNTLKQTLDLARYRMVGPETLVGFGQFVPAIYLPEDINAGVPA